MRAFMLAATAAVLTGITPAQASVLTVGGGYAATCYRSAESRVIDRNAFQACNQALSTEALAREERAGTLVNRGILSLIRGDYADANRDFDAALAIDPNQPEAWLNKGISFVKSGKSSEAIVLIDKALELGTRKPALAYYARAIAHEDSGNIRNAYSDLRRTVSLAPKWREPVMDLARYQVKPR